MTYRALQHCGTVRRAAVVGESKRNKLVALLHKIPYAGKWIEPALRKTWRKVDHLAAMLASHLLS